MLVKDIYNASVLLSITLGYTLIILTNADIFQHLNYFEVIDEPHSPRVKRSVLGAKDIVFRAFGRNFMLHLSSNRDVLHKDFKVSIMDAYGNTRPAEVPLPDLYDGFLDGDPHSSVRARFDMHDAISASILTNNDMFVIEPLSRYQSENQRNSSMLIYRQSDLKLDPSKNRTICRSMVPPLPPPRSPNSNDAQQVFKSYDQEDSSQQKRRKRSTDDKKTCDLLLVADTKFHKRFDTTSVLFSSHFMVEIIDRVNQIYQKTEFISIDGELMTGYGFSVKDIIIHESFSYDANSYDRNNVKWESETLLKHFSYNDYSKYCLAHLFTYETFDNGILGLAWIASPYLDYPGGICSNSLYMDGKMSYLNTAWTTFLDSAGDDILLTLTSILVTTHELSHNWGSSHDPDTLECSPQEGKFLMYTYAVNGDVANNKLLSPCSRRTIGSVLTTRGPTCFSPSQANNNTAFCGNKRKDPLEECDAGVRGDICCTAQCKLKSHSECSPSNGICCSKQCKYFARNVVCSPFYQMQCKDETTCTGVSEICPPPRKLSTGKCWGGGQCIDGKCKQICEQLNNLPCLCEKDEDMCKVCCRANANATCLPTFNNWLKEGQSCLKGFCKKNVCVRPRHRMVERFWQLIEQLKPNLFAKFMWDNLVGTVIFFSLIVWIPLCIFISYKDYIWVQEEEAKRYPIF